MFGPSNNATSNQSRRCLHPEHTKWFPSIAVDLSRMQFYGEQEHCMACADLTRLVDFERLQKDFPEPETRPVFVTPSYSLAWLQRLPMDAAGMRCCAHPLHAQWFPSRGGPLPNDAFANDEAACRDCVACNRIMNSRNEERNRVQREELELQSQERKKVPKLEKSATRQRLAQTADSGRLAAPPRPPTVVGRALKPPKSEVSMDWEISVRGRQRDRKRHAPAPLPENCKVRRCVGCEVEFVFFPDHEAFHNLPEGFVCNQCVDRVICFGCGVGDVSMDDQMILCDGCLVQGAHCTCLGLEKVPDGSWYCVDCVWKHESHLLGEMWLCSECGLLNHTRWEKLALMCVGCRHMKKQGTAVWWKDVATVARVEWAAPFTSDEVHVWGWTDIADYCFVLAYAKGDAVGAASLDRSKFLDVLKGLNMTATDWLKKGFLVEGDGDGGGNPLLQPYYDMLVEGAKRVMDDFEHPGAVSVSGESRTSSPSTSSSSSHSPSFDNGTAGSAGKKRSRSKMYLNKHLGDESSWRTPEELQYSDPPGLFTDFPPPDVNTFARAWSSCSTWSQSAVVTQRKQAVTAQVKWSSRRHENFGMSFATMKDSSTVPVQDSSDDVASDFEEEKGKECGQEEVERLIKQKKILAERAASDGRRKPLICGLEHSYVSHGFFEKYVGRLVWVRLGDNSQWAPAQTYALRDVPAEYFAQVVRMREGLDNLVQLVLFFSVPNRAFAWTFPDRGEVASFNMDWMERYMEYSAITDASHLATSLAFVQRIVAWDTVESLNMENGWLTLPEMRGVSFDVGRLVWARPSGQTMWWPATVSSESEVPPDLLPQVLDLAAKSKVGEPSVLVLFFDAPVNNFGWVPVNNMTIQPFRGICVELLKEYVKRFPRPRKVEEWVACVRRSLLFESVCVPSQVEGGTRWMCELGCKLANLPMRVDCALCRLPRHHVRLKDFAVPYGIYLGSSAYENAIVSFRGLKMKLRSPQMPLGKATLLYRKVTVIAFALSSPTPFVALYTKSADTRPRVAQDWVVLLLPDERPCGDMTMWGLVYKLRRFVQTLDALKNVQVLDIGPEASSMEVFGHPRFFEDPLACCAGAFGKVFTK